jgi:hypothetical protein
MAGETRVAGVNRRSCLASSGTEGGGTGIHKFASVNSALSGADIAFRIPCLSTGPARKPPQPKSAFCSLEHLVPMTMGSRIVGQPDALLTQAEKNLRRITARAADALAGQRESQRLQSNQFKAGIISEAKNAIAAAGTS